MLSVLNFAVAVLCLGSAMYHYLNSSEKLVMYSAIVLLPLGVLNLIMAFV